MNWSLRSKLGPATLLQTVLLVFAVVISEHSFSQSWRAAFTAPGRIETAMGTISIGTAASGVVASVLVHEGSRVQAGQLLVTIACQPIEAEIEMLNAQLRAAEAAFDRVRNGPRRDEI